MGSVSLKNELLCNSGDTALLHSKLVSSVIICGVGSTSLLDHTEYADMYVSLIYISFTETFRRDTHTRKPLLLQSITHAVVRPRTVTKRGGSWLRITTQMGVTNPLAVAT